MWKKYHIPQYQTSGVVTAEPWNYPHYKLFFEGRSSWYPKCKPVATEKYHILSFKKKKIKKKN